MYVFYLLAIYKIADNICKVVRMNTKAEITLNLTNVLNQMKINSKQLKLTISNVVYLVPISYKLRFTENKICIQMVHSQLVIKIKLLRSEHGCLFSYPLCLIVD